MTKLDELTAQIKQCTRCERRQYANAPVPGFGDIGAKYFLIGRDPGREENREGIPFIGAAGRRLNELLALANIDTNDCYITNLVKCHVPGNKPPRKSFITACKPWVLQEIALVKPETIITLGSEALSLFCDRGITQMHGTQIKVDLNYAEVV